MKLSEIREILAANGIQLTKSLGQNFLHDTNALRRIVELAALQQEERVLEIGPGLGPLTELLLAAAGSVLAVELDARLIPILRRRLPDPRLEIIHADAVQYLKHQPRDWSEYKLVANLPYSAASPILVELARGAKSPKLLVATLQLEVARRLMAAPGDADYGLLTLLVQVDFEPREWFKISRGCFFPEPDVDSACVCLGRRAVPMVSEVARPIFRRLIKRAFSERRKMMLKLLKQEWPVERPESIYSELNLDPKIRAERVSLAQFARFAERLSTETAPAERA